MKYRVYLLITLFVLSILSIVNAQGKLIPIQELQNRNYYPTRINDAKFMGKSDSYSFVKDGKSLWLGSSKEDAKEVLKLSDITPTLKTFVGIIYVTDKQFIYRATNDGLYVYDMDSKTTKKLNSFDKDIKVEEINYNSSNIAYKQNDNLFVMINNEKKQITTDGTKDLVYGEAVHRNEFGIEKGLFWNESGDKLAFYKMDQSMVTDYPLVNTEERVAKVTPIKYPMAGMKSHEVLIGIYDVKNSSTVYLKTRHNESVEEREMYLTNITWAPDGKTIYVAKLNRLQNHLWVESYDAITGSLIRVLFEETSPKYVEPETGLYFIPNSSDKFLWLSERDGFNHIYEYDITGKLIKQVTSGKWMVKSIDGFNEKGDEVYISATKDSPIENNIYGVNLKNDNIRRITPDHGTHSIAFNSKGTLFIDSYSNYNITSMSTLLLDNKGKTIKTLHQSEDPWKNFDKPTIEISTIKAKDGTDLYYRMIKPMNFDPNKKYPVFVYVYGGPHAQMITDSWTGGAGNFLMFMAQQGFIVWTIDNRGSANRGYEFESAIWHNCGTIEVSDQIDGVNYLKTLPYIDKDRISVDGWSYGGFMTISLMLKNPGVFDIATAGGPVIDWKWYEVMYGERYMGTPENNPEGYKNASLLNYIDNLQGKLLIFQGYQDNTVVPQNSLEFIRNAVKEGKQVDYFMYTAHEHNVRGKDRIDLYEKIYNYHKSDLK